MHKISDAQKNNLPCLQAVFNPLHAGTELFQFNIVNNMVADALAPCVARTTALMILTM